MKESWNASGIFGGFEFNPYGPNNVDGEYDEYRVIDGDGDVFTYNVLDDMTFDGRAALISSSRQFARHSSSPAERLAHLVSMAKAVTS